MTAPFPSFTKSWHTDTYDAISPKRSELSLKGKKVVVVGGGSGIGRGLSQAFADAGASSLVILGRRTALLEETKSIIEEGNPAIEVTTLAVDIVNASAVKIAAKSIGVWDVLVLSAGYLPEMNSIVDSDVDEWWRGCEVNIKGSFNVCHSLLPQKSKNASIISISAGSCHVQIDFQVNASGYNISKFALLKFFEILAAENPDVHVVSMHPGVDMFRKGKMQSPSMDTVELPSHFTVWLCSEEAKFLRGRMVWCNWDVDEIKSRKAEVEKSPTLLTGGVEGWTTASS